MALLGIFNRGIPDSPDTQVGNSQITQDVEGELRSVILEQLLLGGISASIVSIEIRRVGQAEDGRSAFMCMLRMATWEQRSAIRLMLGLPLLQAKVRKAVVSGWLNDQCHFAGIWLHSSRQLEGETTFNTLRTMIVSLERETGEVQQSVWSAPMDMEGSPTSG